MLKQLSHLIFITILSTLLFACGGGGGGGSTGNNSNNPGASGKNIILLEGSDKNYEPKNIAIGARIAVRNAAYEGSGYWYAGLYKPETNGDYEFSWTSSASLLKFAGNGCTYTQSQPLTDCSYSDGSIEVIKQNLEGESVTVKVFSTDGEVAKGSVSFYIKDLPPVARLISPTADRLGNVVVGQSVTVDGRNSYDTQSGSISKYVMQLKSKPSGSAAVLNFTDTSIADFVPDIAGVYVVSFYVEDDIKQRSNVVEKNIRAMPGGSENKLYVEVDVSSPIIDTSLKQNTYTQHPYSVVSSGLLTVHEKVGNSIILNATDKNNTGNINWVYELQKKPAGSLVTLDCSSGKPCTGPGRTLKPDKRGEYLVSAIAQQGNNKSIPALIKIISTANGENALPMLGDILIYEHNDECVSKELSALWAVDADGPVNFNWRVIALPRGANNSILTSDIDTSRSNKRVEIRSDAYASPDGSARSVMVSASTAGAYIVEVTARDRGNYSEPAYAMFNIDNSQLINPKCNLDSDNDGYNDFHDPTPNGSPSTRPRTKNGSYGGISSCTTGSACTGFYTNRILYGY